MITLTPAALEQVKSAAQSGGHAGMGLRIAVTRQADGSLHYGMGFDAAGEEDVQMKLDGVTLIIGPAYIELMKGMTVDYVEIEPGQFNFIFLNPNDPAYSPPNE